MSTIVSGSGIIVMIVVWYLMFSLACRFGTKARYRWSVSLIFGLASGWIVAMSPKVPALVAMPLHLLTIIVMMVYMICWFNENGSTAMEFIDTLLVDLLLLLAGCSAAARVYSIDFLATIKPVVAIIRAIPFVIFGISIVLMIFHMVDWVNLQKDPEEFSRFCKERLEDRDVKASDFKMPPLKRLKRMISKRAKSGVRRWLAL